MQSKKLLKDDLKEALSYYRNSYHLCKGIYSLNYKLDEDTSKTKLEQLGLFEPEKHEEFYFSMYMNEKPLNLHSKENVEAGIPNGSDKM